MNSWTPSAVAELINDVGNWVLGIIIFYTVLRGMRTMITGK